MNPLIYIIVLISIISIPAVLITAVWLFVIKRGWGSKWLVSSLLIAFGLAALVVVLWFGTQDNSILFMGLGMSALSGIGFYFFLRTSPAQISEAFTGQNQNAINSWSSLSSDEEQERTKSAKIAVKDGLLKMFLQYIPIIIGLAIILLFRSSIPETAPSLGLFIMGFTGILRIILRSKYISSELYSSKSKIAGNVFITLFAWSLAVYGLFNR